MNPERIEYDNDEDPTTRHIMASSSNGIFDSRFRVGKKLREGSYGVVFEGESHSRFFVSTISVVRPRERCAHVYLAPEAKQRFPKCCRPSAPGAVCKMFA